MNTDTRSNGSILERHLQTTIQFIIVAVLLWFGSNVVDNGKVLVKLTTLMEAQVRIMNDHEIRLRSLETAEGSKQNKSQLKYGE